MKTKIRLFEDDEMMELFQLYRKYHRPIDMATETGISKGHCSRIYNAPDKQNFSLVLANIIKKTLIDFKERLGEQNATNAEIKTDAFYNSHVVTDFDKTNAEILKEALIKENISLIKQQEIETLLDIYQILLTCERQKNEK